jgi:endogenous inhibitor of DNA gyrase (YacG/DUF329 family)
LRFSSIAIAPTEVSRTLLMRCPTCERQFNPADSPAMPFCSERCRLIDLGRWLDEGYTLPAIADPDDESEVEDRLPEEP